MEAHFASSEDQEWTAEENRLLLEGLTFFDRRSRTFFEDIARNLPGRTITQVVRQYQKLWGRRINLNESGSCPTPVDEANIAIETTIQSPGNVNHHHIKRKRDCWKREEHELFLEGFRKLGKDWTGISEKYVKTRSCSQVANHAYIFLDFVKKARDPNFKSKSIVFKMEDIHGFLSDTSESSSAPKNLPSDRNSILPSSPRPSMWNEPRKNYSNSSAITRGPLLVTNSSNCVPQCPAHPQSQPSQNFHNSFSTAQASDPSVSKTIPPRNDELAPLPPPFQIPISATPQGQNFDTLCWGRKQPYLSALISETIPSGSTDHAPWSHSLQSDKNQVEFGCPSDSDATWSNHVRLSSDNNRFPHSSSSNGLGSHLPGNVRAALNSGTLMKNQSDALVGNYEDTMMTDSQLTNFQMYYPSQPYNVPMYSSSSNWLNQLPATEGSTFEHQALNGDLSMLDGSVHINNQQDGMISHAENPMVSCRFGDSQNDQSHRVDQNQWQGPVANYWYPFQP